MPTHGGSTRRPSHPQLLHRPFGYATRKPPVRTVRLVLARARPLRRSLALVFRPRRAPLIAPVFPHRLRIIAAARRARAQTSVMLGRATLLVPIVVTRMDDGWPPIMDDAGRRRKQRRRSLGLLGMNRLDE